MIYTQVLSKGGRGVRSPVNGLAGLYSLYNPEWAIGENAEIAGCESSYNA